jgi:hypothetical protein
MNPKWWQQQQQQMQRMREQQMKGYYWQQQQKEKKLQEQQIQHKREAELQAIQEGQPLSSGYPGDDPFTQVERGIIQLRQDLAAGKLTPDEANARLNDLYVQDERGNYWTVAINSGEWQCFDGNHWIAKHPPRHSSVAPLPVASEQPVTHTKKHPFLGLITFVFGIVVTAVAGFFVGNIVFSTTSSNGLALLAAIIIWALGFILTVKKSRKVFRGAKPL